MVRWIAHGQDADGQRWLALEWLEGEDQPSNLFLVGGDPRRVKLLDFGIARRSSVTRTITRSGVVIGTAGYIAPEQVRGDPTDARADVFVLGAVLYECLAGRPAFAGGPAWPC